ncbi:lipid A biosynthesis lauroyl acyltransferase [Actinorhabdospora filicis]|uniref:Lipid A biosynthesis lauroyl acyltransferase n=1 Tax=Actinorhabdospora filicis TaxID=1785913 RepID=A0A9W6W8A3_9ACTN|nr:phosphatidylinositol mannoside acyltransferase [Actinorhabdospora filicis]GLZ75455.1 lipid A biosynthesis lauroyl acyltransferase [Actinorhabdospora filicis]
MKDKLTEWAYGAAWRLVRALPESWAAGLFRAGADRAARKNGPSIQRLRGNLRRVVGEAVPEAEMDVLVRDGMRSYARYWLEAFRLPTMGHETILDRFILDNYEVFDKHREEGTGVIVALPHSGNWDLAGAWVCAKGYPITTVAERLKPEAVYEKFLAFRRSLGMEIIPHAGGDRSPIDALADAIKERHVVPLLGDRDLSRRGVEVSFFGGRTRMPAGPGLLALRTGAPIYTVVVHNEGRIGRGELKGPVPIPTEGTQSERVAAITQYIADDFAAGIAAHPADWHMLQRMWLDKPGRPA